MLSEMSFINQTKFLFRYLRHFFPDKERRLELKIEEACICTGIKESELLYLIDNEQRVE